MTPRAPKQNGLLAALPAVDYERLSASLELVRLPLGRAVYEPGGPLGHVYFPTDSIISLLSVTQNGSSAEIALTGNDGLVGIASFMGGETTSSRAVVQHAGYAYRVPVVVIQQEFDRGGALQLLLLRYTQALITQMSQTALCNRHHSLEQQLCRWLLLSVDRLPSNTLEMTEELIANMLGVPPEGIASATGRLQADGLIRYRQGAFTVLDRPGLERRACECYAVVRRELGRLLRLPARATAQPLSVFIRENLDAIVAQWSPVALRDQARRMLEVIAQDIQSGGARAALRAGGVGLLQLGVELQALRATVTTLWQAHPATAHDRAAEELARFHQMVDRMLAESIAGYADEAARSRDSFLAILAHDLRNPLGAVSMSGHYLSRAGVLEGKQQLQAVACIRRGAAQMDAMIEDLLDCARTRLGRGLPIARKTCNIGNICDAVLEEMQAGHPARVLSVVKSGDLGGSFDGPRVRQVLANLLSNALQHGGADSPVILEVHGGPEAIMVRVKNFGHPIPADALDRIFEPMVQGPAAASGPDPRRSSGLGLGLFIARSIVAGHGGTLEVASSERTGTVFTARFPRGSLDVRPPYPATGQETAENR